MNIIICLFIILISFAANGLLYYLSGVIDRKVNKTKYEFIKAYSYQLTALIPALILLLLPVNNFGLLSISRAFSGYSVPIMIITVAIVVILVSFSSNNKKSNKKEILQSGLSGALMEIMQRFFMQNFIFMLASSFRVKYTVYNTILTNAIFWCISILYIQVRKKKAFDKDFIIEEVASFIFSIGVGYIYFISGSLILPMIAHFLERVISKIILNKKADKITVKTGKATVVKAH